MATLLVHACWQQHLVFSLHPTDSNSSTVRCAPLICCRVLLQRSQQITETGRLGKMQKQPRRPSSHTPHPPHWHRLPPTPPTPCPQPGVLHNWQHPSRDPRGSAPHPTAGPSAARATRRQQLTSSLHQGASSLQHPPHPLPPFWYMECYLQHRTTSSL